jgi:hypothetical protein
LLCLLIAVSVGFAQPCVDSTGRTYYNFKTVRVHKNHGKITLEDTSGKTAVNICPALKIDKLCSISRQHSAAIVRSGGKYHVINCYGDTSVGFEREPLVFVSHANSIFTYRTKKAKFPCLYDMQGNELGKISSYTFAELADTKDADGETYIRIYNAQDKQGLVNAKGELLLECKYDYISAIEFCACRITINGRYGRAYLDKLKPVEWK